MMRVHGIVPLAVFGLVGALASCAFYFGAHRFSTPVGVALLS
jgi:hypothetical protein